jgi:hypothetical protein
VSAEVSRRRVLTFTVTVSIDVDKGNELTGDQGWISPDGDFQKPMTGLEIRSDLLAWSLARQVFDTYGETLDAVVLDAFARIGDEIAPEFSEF